MTGSIGRLGLTDIKIRHAGGARTIATDCLAVSGGWNPSVHLTCHMNGRPVWREDIAAFVPAEGAVPGMIACGAANGVFSTAGCLADGLRAAEEALAALGREGEKVSCARGFGCEVCPDAVLACAGQRAGLARFPERCDREGHHAGRAGELPLGRAYEALHHARDGDGSGQELEHGGVGDPGRCDRPHDPRRPGPPRSARPLFPWHFRRWARVRGARGSRRSGSPPPMPTALPEAR